MCEGKMTYFSAQNRVILEGTSRKQQPFLYAYWCLAPTTRDVNEFQLTPGNPSLKDLKVLLFSLAQFHMEERREDKSCTNIFPSTAQIIPNGQSCVSCHAKRHICSWHGGRSFAVLEATHNHSNLHLKSKFCFGSDTDNGLVPFISIKNIKVILNLW